MDLRLRWLAGRNLRTVIIPIFFKRNPGRVTSGAGLFSRTIGTGSKYERTMIYSGRSSKSFTGDWWADVDQWTESSATFTMKRGFVNGLEPVGPDGKKISESLLTGDVPEDGETWIVVRVQVDPKTGLMVARKQEDVSVDSLSVMLMKGARGPAGDKGIYGYAPLAVLSRRSAAMTMHQVAYFSYRHSTFRRNALSPWRHAFHVA